MAQAKCRCGQPLEVPAGEVTHLICPKCAARVRIVRKARPEAAATGSDPAVEDGFIRFACPCGRKLKVPLLERPSHGKCPECGRVVPVPNDAAAYVSAESPTAEMPAMDQARLDAWAQKHLGAKVAAAGSSGPPRTLEKGLRVCPKCGKPIHMGADACRTCGIAVPRR